ncbi:MAG: DUF488 domain-containing protein [Oscillospiraceae bacterium]|nr:DUF488 domain-containing protein [Oscillospiraceae bacterium]
MNNPQPTYRRQRFLLDFMRQIGGSVSNTELQKLVFLYTMKNRTDLYEFIPYKFGAYSFQLAEDVEILNRDGFLTLGGTSVKVAGEYSQTNLIDIETVRGNDLIRKAYREYPYYAINSEMINSLFYGAEADRFNNEKSKYINSEQTLFTIGYEGKTIEAFINILLQHGIKLLCDVRKNPLSRKFGFSKGKLEHIAGTVGIKYIHIPELGIESEKRSALETIEDYELLFEDYVQTLPYLELHLDWIYSLLLSNIRIALMCYEEDAMMCHRHVIKNYIANAHKTRSVNL